MTQKLSLESLETVHTHTHTHTDVLRRKLNIEKIDIETYVLYSFFSINKEI